MNSNGAPVESLYWLQYDVVENTLQPGTGSSVVSIHGSSDFQLLISSSLPITVGTHRVLIRRVADTADGLWVFVSSQQTSGLIKIDNISLREAYGNHPHITTSINRPVLSSRVNFLKDTEDISSDAYVKTAGVTTSGSDTVIFTGTQQYFGQTFTERGYEQGASVTGRVVISGTSGETIRLRIRSGGGTYEFGSRLLTVSDQPTVESFTYTFQNADHTSLTLDISSFTGNTARQVIVTQWDLRYTDQSNDLIPKYQRVGDVDTAPGDYDSLNFPMYLAFNGTNQSLKVTGMRPEVDKVFISASVRTLKADIHRAVVSYGWASAGSCQLYSRTPTGNGFASKGDNYRYAITYDTIHPSSAVMTGMAKISDNFVVLRINGEQRAVSTGDQGGGNYGDYVLRIGSQAGTSMFYDGRIYGFLLVFDNPVENIITTIERELNRKAKIHA